MDVEYYVDGTNFKTFGVYVSASKGLVGSLARKSTTTVDYSDYHGIARDNTKILYKERTIQLSCFVYAKSRQDFVDKVQDFFALFNSKANVRLKVEYNGKTMPLVYQVTFSDESDVDKNWACDENGQMVGTFTLKLTEDEPVKKVYRSTSSSVAITINTPKVVSIYWGDGTATYNVFGDQSISHYYSETGTHEIIVAGVIEDIASISCSNASLLWNLLK